MRTCLAILLFVGSFALVAAALTGTNHNGFSRTDTGVVASHRILIGTSPDKERSSRSLWLAVTLIDPFQIRNQRTVPP